MGFGTVGSGLFVNHLLQTKKPDFWGAPLSPTCPSARQLAGLTARLCDLSWLAYGEEDRFGRDLQREAYSQLAEWNRVLGQRARCVYAQPGSSGQPVRFAVFEDVQDLQDCVIVAFGGTQDWKVSLQEPNGQWHPQPRAGAGARWGGRTRGGTYAWAAAVG